MRRLPGSSLPDKHTVLKLPQVRHGEMDIWKAVCRHEGLADRLRPALVGHNKVTVMSLRQR